MFETHVLSMDYYVSKLVAYKTQSELTGCVRHADNEETSNL